MPRRLDNTEEILSDLNLPTITIVTPSFNQGRYIERTIQSVLQQDYPKVEYIVIDGGSTDETLNILRRYEGQLRWISEKDSGQSEAINKGFKMARGEIIAWLNSDDVYMDGALKRVGKHFAEHPDVMMVYGEGYMIDELDVVKSRFPFTEPKFDLWKLIYFGDYILQQSTFFRRSVLNSIGMLGETLHYTMDWDLFIRIGKRFRIDYIPEYLGSIREHGEAKTSLGGRVRFKEIKKLIRTHGFLRYPLAYFNYAWDAYGKMLVDGPPHGMPPSAADKLRSSAKKVVEGLFAVYRKRIVQGAYADGWVSRKGMLVLPNCDPSVPKGRVVLRGEANGPNIPFRVKVAINRATKQSFEINRRGPFVITKYLPSDISCDDCYHVEITTNRSFVPSTLGPSSDDRELAFVLRGAELLYRDDEGARESAVTLLEDGSSNVR